MDIYQSLDALFFDLIKDYEENADFQFIPHSKIYLLHLLKKLSNNSIFLDNDEMSFVELYLKALNEESNTFEKIKNLRSVGDICLVFSGLFPDYLTKHITDYDYYVEMSRNSYYHLANLYSKFKSKKDNALLYNALVDDFFEMLDVMVIVGERVGFIKNEQLFKFLKKGHRGNIKKYREYIQNQYIIKIEDYLDKN